MNSLKTTLLLALSAVSASAVIIDGSKTGDEYGDPLSIQVNGTSFGDNFSELNAAYAKVEGETLFLMLTGNLENNSNRLEIFFDSIDGGQNVIDASTNAANDGWAGRFDGFIFDEGFEADFMVIARHDGSRVLDIDFATIGQDDGSRVGRFNYNSPPSTGPFTTDNGLVVGFDNTNAAGLSGTADDEAATAVATGLEFAIPLALLGDPSGEIKVSAMINGSSHDYLSNQFLGPLPEGSGSLGTDGSGSFVNDSPLTIDLADYDGDQFFVVPPGANNSNPASFTKVDTGFQGIAFELADTDTSVVDVASVVLIVDQQVVTPVIEKVGAVTSISYTPEPGFVPGTMHAFSLELDDLGGNFIGRDGEFSLPLPFLPGDPIADLAISAGSWAIRQIWDFSGEVLGLADAVAVAVEASSDDFEGSMSDALVSTLNHGSGGIFPEELLFPAQEAGEMPDDNFVILAQGIIQIPEAGDWTIGVHSDDGFALRIVGAEFSSAHGVGILDPADFSVFGMAEPTGDSDTRGILRNLPAGDYPVEIVYWEGGFGDHLEVYAAKGAFENDADSSEWKLIGYQSEKESITVPGVSEAGWEVRSSEPGGVILETIDLALDDLEEVTDTTNHPAINFNDPETELGNSGSIPGDVPWPGNTDVDDDDYAIMGEAILVVPEAGTYLLGFQGDDGGFLQVEGQSFGAIVENASGGSTGEGSDTIACDCLTGNSRTVAEIALAAGSYPIRVLHYDRGLGSSFEVFAGQSGSPQKYLLEQEGAGTRSVNSGLALVGDSFAFAITDISLNADGSAVTLVWSSRENSQFTVEASSDLQNWDEIVDGVDSGGLTTSYTELLELPVAAERYYRVRVE